MYACSAGAFNDRGNAERLKARIERYYHPVVIQTFDRGDGIFNRVRVGQEPSEDSAQQLAHLDEISLGHNRQHPLRRVSELDCHACGAGSAAPCPARH